MNSQTFLKINGYNKPFNIFHPIPRQECFIPQKHSQTPTTQNDQTTEKADLCQSNQQNCRGNDKEPAQKRFKPNTFESRSRFASKETEASMQSVRSNSPPSFNNINNSTGNPIISPESNDGKNQEGAAQCGEEENADEDGDCPGNNPPSKNPTIQCNIAKDSSFIAERTSSTLTSPLLSCTESTSSALQRDLSLGHRDSIDSCEQQPQFPEEIRNPKIRSKLAAKEEKGNQNLLAEAQNLAKEIGFECISKECQTEDSLLTFKCSEGHKLTATNFLKTKNLECSKCQRKLEECVEYAKSHNGKVLNKNYNSLIEYECEKKHVWKIKYSKYMFTKWCSQCSKLNRQDKLKAQQEEAKLQQQKIADEQNRVLEEARRQMLEEEQKQKANYQYLFENWPSNTYLYTFTNYGLNDDSINKLAKERAESYMGTKEYNGRTKYEDIQFMHKILLTSPEMILAKLWIIPLPELSSFYRKNAMRLHPDKNCHPQAMEAFQKFAECYKLIVNRKK